MATETAAQSAQSRLEVRQRETDVTPG